MLETLQQHSLLSPQSQLHLSRSTHMHARSHKQLKELEVSAGLPCQKIHESQNQRACTPVVTRFFCPPEMPLIISLPTKVSAQTCTSNRTNLKDSQALFQVLTGQEGLLRNYFISRRKIHWIRAAIIHLKSDSSGALWLCYKDKRHCDWPPSQGPLSQSQSQHSVSCPGLPSPSGRSPLQNLAAIWAPVLACAAALGTL